MIDAKQLVINDLEATLAKIERSLRAAGSIEFQCYHNARDRQLAEEFLKMADEANRSLEFSKQIQMGL